MINNKYLKTGSSTYKLNINNINYKKRYKKDGFKTY